jgi:putative SOS response-associated peptidase YedK
LEDFFDFISLTFPFRQRTESAEMMEGAYCKDVAVWSYQVTSVIFADPPIVHAIEGEPGAGELVQRRWSWPGQNRKPVHNFRSEDREFASGRCLIPADPLRVHRPGGQEEAEGQVAVHEGERAVVLHRRTSGGQTKARITASRSSRPPGNMIR